MSNKEQGISNWKVPALQRSVFPVQYSLLYSFIAVTKSHFDGLSVTTVL